MPEERRHAQSSPRQSPTIAYTFAMTTTSQIAARSSRSRSRWQKRASKARVLVRRVWRPSRHAPPAHVYRYRCFGLHSTLLNSRVARPFSKFSSVPSLPSTFVRFRHPAVAPSPPRRTLVQLLAFMSYFQRESIANVFVSLSAAVRVPDGALAPTGTECHRTRRRQRDRPVVCSHFAQG